jgi:hypothetical protein
MAPAAKIRPATARVAKTMIGFLNTVLMGNLLFKRVNRIT